MQTETATARTTLNVAIRPLSAEDLPAADQIMRLAFGTFLGLPEPLRFMGDADPVRTRWKADPSAAFGAHLNGALAGSNFATNWGSVSFFGPITVRPELWDRGIAQQLLGPTMDLFAKWGTTLGGLFTFPQSARHIGLYQKFGFWPRFLTPIMSKSVTRADGSPQVIRYSALAPDERENALRACRELTEAIYEGLNVEREIRAVASQGLGETILLWDSARLIAFAVCHVGAGSEAGSGACYVKFAAVRPGPAAAQRFDGLLDACEDLAATLGAAQLVAGVNTGRHDAYRALLAHGFRTDMEGLAMQRHNGAGYNRPDIYLIDDWR